jgi:hypothetical protein
MTSYQAPISKTIAFGMLLLSFLLTGAALAKTQNLASSLGLAPVASPQVRMHAWQDAFAAFFAKHPELTGEQAQTVRNLLGIGDETFFADTLSLDQRMLFVNGFTDLQKMLPNPTFTDLSKQLSNLHGWLTSNKVIVGAPDAPTCNCSNNTQCVPGFVCSSVPECLKAGGSTNNGLCVRPM